MYHHDKLKVLTTTHSHVTLQSKSVDDNTMPQSVAASDADETKYAATARWVAKHSDSDSCALAQQLVSDTYSSAEATFVNTFFESSKEAIAILDSIRQAYLPFNAKIYALFEHVHAGAITVDQLYTMFFTHDAPWGQTYYKLCRITQDFALIDYTPLYNGLNCQGFAHVAHTVYIDHRINMKKLVDYFLLERALIRQALQQSDNALLQPDISLTELKKQLHSMYSTKFIAHGYFPCTPKSHHERSQYVARTVYTPAVRVSSSALRFALQQRTQQLQNVLCAYQYYANVFEKNTDNLCMSITSDKEIQDLSDAKQDVLVFLYSTYTDKLRVARACIEQIQHLLCISNDALSEVPHPIQLPEVSMRLINATLLNAIYDSYSSDAAHGSCRICLEIGSCCYALLAYSTLLFCDRYSLLQPRLDTATA